MRSFIEVRNEQLKSAKAVEQNSTKEDWSAEEVWQMVAKKGGHEAWIDISLAPFSEYGLVAYYNSETGYCDVSRNHVAKSADGKVLVCDQEYYTLPGNLYVLAE